ncbi:type II toxin-antitoxin system antitoxin SocA domain-containing protein [Psychrobacillus sp.]|uniref:type II toxin-antitoxin system antitoxin SocA domain-containing protein n=1 Tax=Psychrobacillus sp. TaxID=1871623 RepID=UPI0028BDA874|nr:type II toxin-antitoxin system antitoxin SocA domain-containing protein [Psychrobacillus sp.]
MEYGERIVSETNESVPIYLSSIERESLQVIFNFFGEYTSNEISNFSHEERAWKEIKNNFTIPYAYAEF